MKTEMSFGDELRRERELRQIALREVAEATKVNIRYLEALERNDFAHLPGGVFNRGFVRAYAQFIGVDPEAMVNAYILEERAQSDAAAGVPPAAPSPVLRGAQRAASKTTTPARPTPRPAPARAAVDPPSHAETAPDRSEPGPSTSVKIVRYGLLVVASGILALFAYLVWDVLRDPTLPRPGSPSAPGVVSSER
jgi:transcriptional regulator with XRE-family HTH domain